MEDKGDLIAIQSPSKLKFIGTELKENLVRTTDPIPLTATSFYFEAKVVSCGNEGVIAIGLTQSNPNTKSGYFPGWNSDPSLGIGYHGDDGGIYHNSGRAVEKTEPFITNDVVGCYMCRTTLNNDEITLVQFTRNGEKILSPRIITNDKWYPTIGLGSPGAIVETNFGVNQFLFNVKGGYHLKQNSIEAANCVRELKL